MPIVQTKGSPVIASAVSAVAIIPGETMRAPSMMQTSQGVRDARAARFRA
jgi:hypothetical protein